MSKNGGAQTGYRGQKRSYSAAKVCRPRGIFTPDFCDGNFHGKSVVAILLRNLGLPRQSSDLTNIERSFYLSIMSTKRQDIIDAANRTFYRDGFAEVGIDRVTGEANVALGTLYRHFKTRSEVIAAALRQRHDDFLLALGNAAEPAHGAECVLGLFDVLEGWSNEHGGNGCFFLRAAADYPADKIVRDAALSHKREYIAAIGNRLQQGGWSKDHAEDLATTIFVLLEGAVAAAFTIGDRAAVAAARKAAALVLENAAPASE